MLGIAKNFNVTAEYALYEISYVNAIMYSHAVPMPFDEDDDAPLYDDSKDACNPANFAKENFEDEEIVRI